MRRVMNVYLFAATTSFASIASYAAATSAASPAVVPADATHSTNQTNWTAIEQYCVDCHNITDWAGGVAFDSMSPDKLSDDAKVWEAAVRKLRGGFMPPPGAKKRPDSQTVKGMVTWLETTLDTSKAEPTQSTLGRVPLRRLNRREYANSVRDLLGLQIDVASLLPADDKKDGFDNNASSLQVSPSFLDQYINAARKVALQAVGNPKALAVTTTYGPIADMEISLPPRGTPGEGTQQLYKDGMPFGTRGGMTAEHLFPADGEYALSIGDMALGRDVPRMEFRNTVIALLDGKEIYRTNIGGDEDQKSIDLFQQPAVQAINARLKNIKFHATAGQHRIAVTFLKRSFAESDERFRGNSLDGGQDRVQAVHALQIRGPLKIDGVSDSPSRTKIFVCHPKQAAEEKSCAQDIVSNLARRAFRRPVTDEDLRPLMAFYENGSKEAGFDAGVRDAISAVLASPYFLYRVESADSTVNGYISDIELATRMSFFIWSSLPDDELLDVAARNELSKPNVLAQQVKRMLADPKAKSMTDDFAFQWLNVSRLDEIVPERSLFPFASGLLDPRPLFREELSLFIDSVLRSDQSLTALLTADYSYLNESLAMLYGIETVKGGQFRRVEYTDSKRSGLLGKGAILMLTANPDRNAPVLRGAWILDRVLGTPPAAPPAVVSALPDAGGKGKKALTMRERMAQHSTNPTCYACHGVMDPLGLTLENFNTVGQFHAKDAVTQQPIDTTGKMIDGTKLNGPEDLRVALLARTDQFAQTITERLMTYALGRGIEYYDMPTVRHIVRDVAKDEYRFSSLVLEVVSSDAFRKRVLDKPAKGITTAALEKTNQVTTLNQATISGQITIPSQITIHGEAQTHAQNLGRLGGN